MIRLFKLKDWVTLDDAARHLSSVLAEEVRRVDILQFAVEGQLTISVNVAHGGTARQGKIVPRSAVPVAKGLPRPKKGSLDVDDDYEVPLGIPLDSGEFIVFDQKLEDKDGGARIEGVWDVPMIGDDRLAVEREFHDAMGIPRRDATTLDGAFISRPNHDEREVWQVLSKSTRRKTNPEWLRRKHAGESLEGFKQVLDEEEAFYYPGDLPDGSFLVVRSDELQRFLSEAVDDSGAVRSAEATGMKARERNAWQAMVGALVRLLVKPSGQYGDHTAVVAKLVALYGDDPPDGLSKSNLRKIKESVDYLQGIVKK